MIKTFQIDFIRAILESKLAKNSADTKFFNDNELKIYSFYESLTSDSEVERYVDNYKKLIDQQNKSSLIGFGILANETSPTITNLKSVFVSPIEWSLSVRCTLANRDKMLGTLYDIISAFKGKKQDVIQLDNGKIVPVGTILNDSDRVKDYDYIGGDIEEDDEIYTTSIEAKLTALYNKGIFRETGLSYLFGITDSDNNLRLFKKVDNDWVLEKNFGDVDDLYKVSMSFDDIKVDQPFVLNAQDYCNITMSGSATIVSSGVRVGNDLISVKIKKKKVVYGNGQIHNFTDSGTILEPLEAPSGNNANKITSQLRSNDFIANSHTDSIAISLQYTFICDMSIILIKELYNYARYGIQNYGSGQTPITNSTICPNIIYEITETYSSFGEIEQKTFLAKLDNNIDIENTESDVNTISLNFQIQGENN